MFRKLKPKSEFSKNVLTLMTGTTIAQAIPIAISPILTRIYTPEDFGIVGLFGAISGIFSSITTGKYELAILHPKKDEDAINIFALGLIINSFVTFCLFLLVAFFANDLAILLNNQSLAFWLYFIPFSVFFIGMFNLLVYFNNREKNYKDISKVTIIKAISLAFIQLSLGFLKEGVVGLISGTLFSQFLGNMKLLQKIIKNKVLLLKINIIKIIALSKRYKNFPKFTMWAGLANILSQNLTNILISFFYGLSTLGFYGLVQRVLGVPSSLIGTAMSQVFYQEAIKEKQETGKSIKSFQSTIKKLIVIAIPSFGVLFFVIEDLFNIVFGEEWKIAGSYGRILILLFTIRFISSPVAIIVTVFEKQKIGLIINLILISVSLTVLSLVFLLDIEFKLFLWIFSFSLSLCYFCFIFYYNHLSKGV